MTSWVTPRTWSIGELVTKAMLDTHVRDNLNHLKEQTTALEAIIDGKLVFYGTPKGNAGYDGDVKNIGSYTIAANTFHADLPNTAKALLVTVSVNWTTASDSNYCNITHADGSYNCLVVRSLTTGYQDAMGIVPLNSSGQFKIVIAGENVQNIFVYVWGYIA